MHRLKMLMVILIGTMLLTACWDKIEIEKRAFIISMGIDKFDPDEVEKKPVESGETKQVTDSPHNRYVITYVYPNTAILAGKGEGEPNFKLTTVGENLFGVQRAIGTRLAGDLDFSHTKIIILGEKLAEDPKLMREVLDSIERDPDMGRKIHLMVSPGTAKELMGTNPLENPALGLFIRDIMEKQDRPARIADADISYILRSLHESKVAIAPRILHSEDEIKVAGAAVLKDYRKIGWLGEKEVRTVMFMMDKIDSVALSVEMDDLIIPVGIANTSTDMKVEERDGEIWVVFDIEMEGQIEQHFFAIEGQTYNNEYIQRLEKALSDSLCEQVCDVFEKLQKEFGADIFQVNEYLRRNKPDLWEVVKEDWEENFKKVKVDVKTDTKIRRIGVVR